MKRRGFLKAILAAGAAPAIVKASNIMPLFVRRDSGLLIPSVEEFAIGAPAGNTLLTIDQITREALRLAHEKMTFINSINSQFDSQFGGGQRITIRRPSWTA